MINPCLINIHDVFSKIFIFIRRTFQKFEYKFIVVHKIKNS